MIVMAYVYFHTSETYSITNSVLNTMSAIYHISGGQTCITCTQISHDSSLPPPSHILGGASGRPVHYKNWSDDRLFQAYQTVQKEESVRRAADSYCVPRSTLFDRVSGRVTFGAKSGPPRYLSDEEEELVNFLCRCAAAGHARSKRDVIALVALKGYREHW